MGASTGDSYAPHDHEWTRETAARFWDYQGRDTKGYSTYFSHQVGYSLLYYTARMIPLRGSVLDYGSGPGFLTEKILRRGLECTALDFSEDSVRAVEQRLGSSPLLKSTYHAQSLPTSIPESSFDVVFFVETIEHLLPDDRAATLDELFRLTRPGGHVVTTTPNSEDLAAHKMLCPECGAIFHQRQHLTSWTPDSLAEELGSHGFEIVSSRALTLLRPTRIRRITRKWWRFGGPYVGHLICIARRPA